jgi:NADPH:quinone reductase-like Zn-dependent oxidoreductase
MAWRRKLRTMALGLLLAVLVLLAGLALVLRYTAACPAPQADTPGPTQMLGIRYRCYGSPQVLELAALPRPEVAGDEILVRVAAAGVNPLDWHYMRGSPYLMRLMSGIGRPSDSRLGVDFAGTVEAVGTEVTRFKPGDAVFGGQSGAFSQFLTLAEDRAVAHKPEGVSFAEAAGVPIAAVTALQALRDAGRVTAGHRVLINGASGGVGTFAVQIAREMGAEVTGVCSTRNLEMVRALGARQVIDYTQTDYTGLDTRYDVIIDNVGNHSLLANRRALRPGGILVMVGAPSGDWIAPLRRPALAALLGPFVDQQLETFLARLSADDLAYLGDLMAQGKLKTVIDRRFPLAEVAEAIRYSESGRARGKIVIDVAAGAGERPR